MLTNSSQLLTLRALQTKRMIAITSDLQGISETQTIVRFVLEIKKRKKIWLQNHLRDEVWENWIRCTLKMPAWENIHLRLFENEFFYYISHFMYFTVKLLNWNLQKMLDGYKSNIRRSTNFNWTNRLIGWTAIFLPYFFSLRNWLLIVKVTICQRRERQIQENDVVCLLRESDEMTFAKFSKPNIIIPFIEKVVMIHFWICFFLSLIKLYLNT